MELWGGPECTVNRVGDTYRDQIVLTGHQERIGDLAAFARLGIRRLRYPALWERIAPDRPEERDWRWTDPRLAEIDRLGMQPILGLLHHGSGPRYTSLIDDEFVALFARQAGETARRYPHVRDWTPINEPLTTARFSLLYGHWYPHARDEGLFWRGLLNQIDATRAAMRAIREHVPDARLIQTEDLGEYHATPPVAEVAAHFNVRRWATWDLLCGMVVPGHPLWERLCGYGLEERLQAIADDPCPPDVIGANYYPTSERFLDHRVEAHAGPLPETGYHDVAAARVLDPPAAGLAGLLRQAWARYGRPLALTECHLGCTREEQVRWVARCWRDCEEVAAEGVPVEGFTAWALLGNVDWNSLITVAAGHYEPGVFDVRGGRARPTAVGTMVRSLATGVSPGAGVQAALSAPGWWERPSRFEHPPFVRGNTEPAPEHAPGRPLVITGATGTLGQALARECELRGIAHVLTDRATLPIHDGERVAAFLDAHRPWAVVNAAGWVRVDDAEDLADACMQANAHGAAVLAAACAERGIGCTLFSSDLVFDGTSDRPYVESDPPAPLCVYGHSKALAEKAGAAALVIRTAAFFSPHDPHNFAWHVEHALRAGERVTASAEHVVTPTYVPDLVRACLDLVVDGERGIWHLTNGDAVSWLAFGRRIAAGLGLDPGAVVPGDAAALGWRAVRPREAALGTTKGRMLPPLDDAIARFATVRAAT
jgi:dTDP-4-dehydrorhamnose reductase